MKSKKTRPQQNPRPRTYTLHPPAGYLFQGSVRLLGLDQPEARAAVGRPGGQLILIHQPRAVVGRLVHHLGEKQKKKNGPNNNG